MLTWGRYTNADRCSSRRATWSRGPSRLSGEIASSGRSAREGSASDRTSARSTASSRSPRERGVDRDHRRMVLRAAEHLRDRERERVTSCTGAAGRCDSGRTRRGNTRSSRLRVASGDTQPSSRAWNPNVQHRIVEQPESIESCRGCRSQRAADVRTARTTSRGASGVANQPGRTRTSAPGRECCRDGIACHPASVELAVRQRPTSPRTNVPLRSASGSCESHVGWSIRSDGSRDLWTTFGHAAAPAACAGVEARAVSPRRYPHVAIRASTGGILRHPSPPNAGRERASQASGLVAHQLGRLRSVSSRRGERQLVLA